ncbi:MAG: type II toxin-antitoxin system Phd/YefM family antitoxin [Deltaproteobacteria bacterium]|nr:type II toxin-antitoxin system Phd/YefM family antitoxin [Deltaproteobacteria bacterium]
MKTKAKEPRVIPVTEFKAKCLKIIDQVNESGDGILISKRGKVTARLSPLIESETEVFSLKNSLRGRLTLRDDILGFSTASEWEGND